MEDEEGGQGRVRRVVGLERPLRRNCISADHISSTEERL